MTQWRSEKTQKIAWAQGAGEASLAVPGQVIQWCYSGVTVVLQWCYSGVTVVLHWCYGVGRVILKCCCSGGTMIVFCHFDLYQTSFLS
jgi:hypothetical protein